MLEALKVATLASLAIGIHAQGSYYDDINFSATNLELKTQLQALINPHTVLDYDAAYDAFEAISKASHVPCDGNSSHIPDVYSSFCWLTDYVGQPNGECGNYKVEGDCFNREHSWPKSWFGGFDYGYGAESDLYELYPTDGYVNGLRGNLPVGNVDRSQPIKYTSSNGCVIGKCSSKDYTGDCFEIADAYKGDFARTYFYLSTCYMNIWQCCDDVGVNASTIKPWMEQELRQWHKLDPVDQYEKARNDMIYTDYQHNRNPYIDYPELVDQINDF